MALKNLFDMVKADRYTQDGREAIIKAQEEETEDKVYQIGEISQKTGLQKTANGWVKPKNGKQPGAKKTEEKTTSTSTAITEWEESAKKDAKAYNENMVVLQNEKGETTAVRESSPDVEKAEAHGYKKMSLVRPDGSVKKHAENAGNKPAESKPSAGNNPGNTSWKEAKVGLINQAGVPLSLNTITFGMTPAWAKKHGYSPEDVNGTAAEVKLAKQIITNQDWSNPEEAVKKINDMDFGYTNWKVTKKESDKVKIEAKDSLGNLRELTIKRQPTGDAAPRILTGDTRIRVRKA